MNSQSLVYQWACTGRFNPDWQDLGVTILYSHFYSISYKLRFYMLNWLHCFYTLSVVDQSTFCKCFIHSVVHIPVLVCYLKYIIVLWYFREVKHLSVSTSYDFWPPPLKKKLMSLCHICMTVISPDISPVSSWMFLLHSVCSLLYNCTLT